MCFSLPFAVVPTSLVLSRRFFPPAQDVEQGAFAGTGRAHDAQHFVAESLQVRTLVLAGAA